MKEKLIWLQKKENRLFLLQIGLAAALPWVCVLLFLLFQGKGLEEVWLPASEWNDELFYFKQVEGMVKYGYPLGYFGFNESHALKLSFAAWSPVLVFPWILWGKLFGWTLLSPYLCNLCLLSVCMGAYVWLVRPSWRQEAVLAALFCLYAPFVRYLLSGMPEIICFSMVILFYGMAIREARLHSAGKLAFLFVLGTVMTWMRPYFLLFLLLPAFLWIRKRGWKGAVFSLPVIGMALLGYALIKHYLGAAYFADLFFTDWIKAFFERGLFGGMRYTLGKLYYMGKDFGIHLIEGCRSGLASGAHFACFTVTLCLLLWQSVRDIRCILKGREAKMAEGPREDKREDKRDDKRDELRLDAGVFTVQCHLLISFVGMFFALLLMYKLTEGSKHLLTFVVAGIFVICLMESRYFGKTILLGVFFLYFYWIMAHSAYDYQVPFYQPKEAEQIAMLQERLGQEITLDKEKTPNFDNVCVWVLSDVVDGRMTYCKWQELYGLPEGMGISCCMDSYVLEHLGELQSKYLAAAAGGLVDLALSERGCQELYRDEDMAYYRLR